MQDKHTKPSLVHERSIDLTRLVLVLLKRAWLLVLVAVLCAGMIFAFSKIFITPMYRSSFTAYVNNRINTTEGQNSTSSSDLTASKTLTYLYQNIILSRSVLMDAAEKCGINDSYATLRENVSTSVASNAAMISVSVDAADPQKAERLAAAIAEVAPVHVARVVDGSSMRIVDYPVLPQGPFAPNSMRLAGLGFMVALLVGAVLVILSDIIVDKVDSAKEMEERYSIAVVGVIPDMAVADKHESSADADKRRRK